jgi:hypothetical protein
MAWPCGSGSACRVSDVGQQVVATDQAGRMSLSEAMFAKSVVTSVWQNLLCKPKAGGLAAAGRGLTRGVVCSSCAVRGKLRKRLETEAEACRAGTDLGRSLVQSCGREVSLDERERAASFKAGGGGGVGVGVRRPSGVQRNTIDNAVGVDEVCWSGARLRRQAQAKRAPRRASRHPCST